MKPKVRELAEQLAASLSALESVECICVNEAAATDTLDPYFALILDVYLSGPLSPTAKRTALYPSHTLFETSPNGTKDRFLVGELPVRVEYKYTSRIEELSAIALRAGSDLWKIRDSGTYVFYRLTHCKVLYTKTDWLEKTVETLTNLSDTFWAQMRSFYQSTMDHFLNDLGASLIQNDSFHYLISASGFIKHACSALLMENGQFEPSHRGYFDQVTALKTLPDEFTTRFESFLRPDSELHPERKYDIAKLIAKSIVGL